MYRIKVNVILDKAVHEFRKNKQPYKYFNVIPPREQNSRHPWSRNIIENADWGGDLKIPSINIVYFWSNTTMYPA